MNIKQIILPALTVLVCAGLLGPVAAELSQSYADYVSGASATSGFILNPLSIHLLPMRVPLDQQSNDHFNLGSVTIDTLLSVLQLFEYQDLLNKAVDDNSSIFLSTLKVTVDWLVEDARNWMNALRKLSLPASCGDWANQDLTECDFECAKRLTQRLKLMQILYQPANDADDLDFPISYDVGATEYGFSTYHWVANMTDPIGEGAVSTFMNCLYE